MSFQIDFLDLDLIEYRKAWDFQEETLLKILSLREQPQAQTQAGILLFCEHPHVYTLGKSGQQNNLLINEDFLKRIDASYYQSNRGGDITYHGPGQIVGYPIFDLEKLRLGVKQYVHLLEEAIIVSLAQYGIRSSRLEGATGVWIDVGTPGVRKICAIGVRISKAISMHGFALNVNTNLEYFSYINPCGFQDKGVTSIQKELGRMLPFNEVKDMVKQKIAEVFDVRISAHEH